MSTFNEIDLTCDECGDDFRGTIWVAVHAGQDPELKELLLGGELNLVSCPECGHVAYQDHFLLYQDPAAELVAYVYPEEQRPQEEELRKMMLRGFREAQEALPAKDRLKYDPILLFGLEALIELLQKEESLAEQSQIAQAICKQNKLDMTLLRPSQARRLGIMRVLPRVGNGRKDSREEILAGIDRLLKFNPALDFYASLKELITADSHWAL